MQIMTQAPVAEVLVNAGRAQGVRTVRHGRRIPPPGSWPPMPRRPRCSAAGRGQHLPADLLREIDTFRHVFDGLQDEYRRPRTAALSGLRCRAGAVQVPDRTCTSAPGIDYLERAYDDAKYGWYSSRPFLTRGRAHHRG